jgi:hypothetical protein
MDNRPKHVQSARLRLTGKLTLLLKRVEKVIASNPCQNPAPPPTLKKATATAQIQPLT